jgi:hypothetical protein
MEHLVRETAVAVIAADKDNHIVNWRLNKILSIPATLMATGPRAAYSIASEKSLRP